MTIDATSQSDVNYIPDFLIKTTLYCGLVTVLLTIPLSIIYFFQHQFIVALVGTLLSFACILNIWYSLHGRYSLAVNSWLVAPICILTLTVLLIYIGVAASYWPFPWMIALYFILPAKRANFFSILTLVIMIPIAWRILDYLSAVVFSLSLLAISMYAYLSIDHVYSLHRLLKEQAATDTLTGLFNRTLLEESLQQAIAQNRRTGVPMTLIIFDVDYFKLINDSLGHDMGDTVLKALGNILKQRIRGSDMAFRLGGEEFLVLVHNTDERRSTEVAESLRQEIAKTALLPDRNITISAGVSGLEAGMDATAWIKICDEKLYQAKEGGRNRVVA